MSFCLILVSYVLYSLTCLSDNLPSHLSLQLDYCSPVSCDLSQPHQSGVSVPVYLEMMCISWQTICTGPVSSKKVPTRDFAVMASIISRHGALEAISCAYHARHVPRSLIIRANRRTSLQLAQLAEAPNLQPCIAGGRSKARIPHTDQEVMQWSTATIVLLP